GERGKQTTHQQAQLAIAHVAQEEQQQKQRKQCEEEPQEIGANGPPQAGPVEIVGFGFRKNLARSRVIQRVFTLRSSSRLRGRVDFAGRCTVLFGPVRTEKERESKLRQARVQLVVSCVDRLAEILRRLKHAPQVARSIQVEP